MEKFIVIKTSLFDELAEKLSGVNKERVARILDHLAESGNVVGKPLSFPFFREKKFNGSRLYYLIYLEWDALLVITIGSKKEQPETIAYIKENLPQYKAYIRQRLIELKII